jgi:hypothetical protein
MATLCVLDDTLVMSVLRGNAGNSTNLHWPPQHVALMNVQ